MKKSCLRISCQNCQTVVMFACITRTHSSRARCLTYSTNRFYSAMTAGALPRRDWRISGHPAPPSLVESDEPIDLTEDIKDDRRPAGPPIHRRKPPKHRTPHEFAAHNAAIKKAFPEGWSPPRKLSREAMEGVRELNTMDPETFTTPVLAERFRISPEAVRRILKSKWEPTREQRARFAERERRQKDQFIQASRLEEMMRQKEVEQERKKWEKPPPKPDDHKSGRVRGINSRDTLTFK